MRNQEAEDRARRAAAVAAAKLALTEKPRIGVILGTGWGDVLPLEDVRQVPLRDLPGFEDLPPEIPGHARQLVCGTVAGRTVLVMRGRVHLNESFDLARHYPMVRLQTELLIQLGAEVLILTNAVGALAGRVDVGDIVILDGFATGSAPPMPMYGGEFHSPEDTLNKKLQRLALNWGERLDVKTGGLAMVRGPFFEGRKYDKAALARTGASVVGMSVLPEACVASVYDGVRVLALSFVTNDDVEEHSHEENQRAAKAAAPKLGDFLSEVIGKLPL